MAIFNVSRETNVQTVENSLMFHVKQKRKMLKTSNFLYQFIVFSTIGVENLLITVWKNLESRF